MRCINILVLLVFMISAALALSFPAYANSAEPPNLTIIVAFPPDDLELTVRYGDGTEYNSARLEKKGWEAYYRFFSLDSKRDNAALVIEYGGNSYECPLDSINLSRYSNLITLDIESNTFTEGVSAARTALLMFLRVTLTLIIEGAVFFAFGYRQKRSLIAFFIVNLVTQGFLNLVFSGTIINAYWFIIFVFLEIIIFITESIAFTLILKEHKRLRAFLFSLSANTASLLTGGMLIALLPV